MSTGPAAEDQGASGYGRSEPANRAIPGLSPDVLSLMMKLHDGGIQGVVCDQLDKGCVTVCGSSDNEVEANIGRFQSAYHSIVGKMKTDLVQYHSTVDHASVTKAVNDLNQKYKECVLILPPGTGTVRIVSSVPRQLDQAKVELQNSLHAVPPVSVCHGGSDLHIEDSIQLKNYKKITLRKSTLVKEKVIVLVNQVKRDLQCIEGVAVTIDTASCGEVQTELDTKMKKKKGKLGDVVITAGGGTLQCSHVYHIIDPESSEVEHCQAWLEKAMLDILKWGESKSIKSIAFPDLIAGSLSKAAVAKVMIDTILNHKFSSKPAIMADIRIVISDDATYACFAQYFAQQKNELANTSSTSSGDATTVGSASTGTEMSNYPVGMSSTAK